MQEDFYFFSPYLSPLQKRALRRVVRRHKNAGFSPAETLERVWPVWGDPIPRANFWFIWQTVRQFYEADGVDCALRPTPPLDFVRFSWKRAEPTRKHGHRPRLCPECNEPYHPHNPKSAYQSPRAQALIDQTPRHEHLRIRCEGFVLRRHPSRFARVQCAECYVLLWHDYGGAIPHQPQFWFYRPKTGQLTLKS